MVVFGGDSHDWAPDTLKMTRLRWSLIHVQEMRSMEEGGGVGDRRVRDPAWDKVSGSASNSRHRNIISVHGDPPLAQRREEESPVAIDAVANHLHLTAFYDAMKPCGAAGVDM